MRNALTVFAVATLILWTDHSTRLGPASAAESGPDAAAAADAGDDWRTPMTGDGWLDVTALLVPSDGSRLPGGQRRNDARDQGSKLVFFDPGKGDNATGEVYWWDGKRIVDSSGKAANAAGAAYGDNPLVPNETAIKAFQHPVRDPRLENSSGYPDWFLLRRGRRHDTCEIALSGGRTQAEPMVVAAYGPLSEGRAIVDTKDRSPFGSHAGGAASVQFHQVVVGLEIHTGMSHLGMHAGCTSPGAPGVPTWFIEDCKIVNTQMRSGFAFTCNQTEYDDGRTYTQQNNAYRGNIAYRTASGLSLDGDWTGVKGSTVEDNVFVADTPVNDKTAGLTAASQLEVRNNRFYANGKLPASEWLGQGNTLHPYANAAVTEKWPDPNRTLKRYVREVLKLTLHDWSDDPLLDADEVAQRVAASEVYDPAGLKTFMAIATNMRRGGTDKIPASGKPSWTGDYPWDARFTGQAVVNWVREGFGMDPVECH